MASSKTSNLLNVSPEIIRVIFLDLSPQEIIIMCNVNKYFKEKICNDYFWKLYIDKN